MFKETFDSLKSELMFCQVYIVLISRRIFYSTKRMYIIRWQISREFYRTNSVGCWPGEFVFPRARTSENSISGRQLLPCAYDKAQTSCTMAKGQRPAVQDNFFNGYCIKCNLSFALHATLVLIIFNFLCFIISLFFF